MAGKVFDSERLRVKYSLSKDFTGKGMTFLWLWVVLKKAIWSFRPAGSTPARGGKVGVFDAAVYVMALKPCPFEGVFYSAETQG